MYRYVPRFALAFGCSCAKINLMKPHTTYARMPVRRHGRPIDLVRRLLAHVALSGRSIFT
jgi:hypothetical protein